METLESLLAKRTDLDYILIECSGMADPGPVSSVFWLDDALDSRLRLDGVVTCVDAKNILHQIQSTSSTASLNYGDGDGGDEAARQIAYADRIIVNKIDLLGQNYSNNDSTTSPIQSVLNKIKEINPTASMRQTTFSVIEDLAWILDANCFDTGRINDIAFQQYVQNEATMEPKLLAIEPCFKCSGDHAASSFCGLCGTDSSPSLTLHRHTTSVGTIVLFCIGSVDLHKMNLWLASILWPNQDETDKVLRARLEESLRAVPEITVREPAKPIKSVIYRVKGVVSVQHSINSAGKVVHASNDFVDDGLSSGYVSELDGADCRRYIVQAVHDLWEVVPAGNNLFWDTNETRCCKIIIIGKFLDEEELKEGFMECFV